MQFSDLYGTELTRELASADTAKLFSIVRRKAAINAAQLEWVKRTECFTTQATVSIVDLTQEYDLEATITDFAWISKQGVSIKIISGATTRYIEGDALEVTTVARLNVEEPGWRAVSPGTPRKVYVRRDGGRIFLGFFPAPDVVGTDTWTVIVPYVIIPADMSLDADEPFTLSGNPVKSLRPWHRALPYFAAFDLEKLRKELGRGGAALQLWEREIEDYISKQKPKGGQHVRFARVYRGRCVRPSRRDPRA